MGRARGMNAAVATAAPATRQTAEAAPREFVIEVITVEVERTNSPDLAALKDAFKAGRETKDDIRRLLAVVEDATSTPDQDAFHAADRERSQQATAYLRTLFTRA